ncbi:thioredoxin-like protein [Aspergillus cavernicola]|uniref:Thioredoxin-like protein n=1 Tax=Aspergillus cavernicola TaxID=176166 RepID=A0ABR4IQG0_9EURO
MSSAQDEFNRLFSNRDGSSVHPEDRNNTSDRDSSADEEDLDPAHYSDSEDMSAAMATRTGSYTIPNTRFDANTGPKGVIADAQAFERARNNNFRKSFVSGTSGADRSRVSYSKSATDAATLLHNSSPPDGSASEADDGDEDKFMRRWRQSRMQELQSHKARRPSPWRKLYGSVDMVDAVGYLDAIEKVPSDQVVVVCLYDPESNTSSLVEDCLNTISARQPSIHFIKLHHEIAEMDHIDPPAILAYRDGDVFATLVDIPQQIPKGRSCSADSLEDLLKMHRVL